MQESERPFIGPAVSSGLSPGLFYAGDIYQQYCDLSESMEILKRSRGTLNGPFSPWEDAQRCSSRHGASGKRQQAFGYMIGLVYGMGTKA